MVFIFGVILCISSEQKFFYLNKFNLKCGVCMKKFVDPYTHHMCIFITVLCCFSVCQDVCVVLVPCEYTKGKPMNPVIDRGVRLFVEDMQRKGFKVFGLGRDLHEPGIEHVGDKLEFRDDFVSRWEGLVAKLPTPEERKDSKLVFYFSGHGSPHGIRLSDAPKGQSQVRMRGVEWNELGEKLGGLEFGATFAILDCCFSGSALEPFFRHDVSLLAAARPEERMYAGTLKVDVCGKDKCLTYPYFTWWLHHEVLFRKDLSAPPVPLEILKLQASFQTYIGQVRLVKSEPAPLPCPQLLVLEKDGQAFRDFLKAGTGDDAQSLAFDEINSISNALDRLRAFLQNRHVRRAARAYLCEQLPMLEHEVSSLRDSLNKGNTQRSRRRHHRRRRHHF